MGIGRTRGRLPRVSGAEGAARELNVAGVIVKPVDLERLLAEVGRFAGPGRGS